MSFNNKIERFFSNFTLEIGTAPSKNLIYLYADYVELLSLFSNQNYISTSDVLDRFKDEGILRQAQDDQDQSELNDENERLVITIFRLLSERSQLFLEDYPFVLENGDKIIIKNISLSLRNKIYIYLLLSSALNIFIDFQSELTTEFELLSTEVLRNFLPPNSVIKSFGKRSDYSGYAVEKITALAKDMITPIESEALNEISNKGMQERGLDLVGWIPFSDNVANYLSIFAQCACGKDWHQKLGETSRYNNYFKFHRQKPIHSLFIPYNLISYNKNTFYRNDEFGNDSLIFERKRIMNYLYNVDFFDFFDSKILVEKCIVFEENIV